MIDEPAGDSSTSLADAWLVSLWLPAARRRVAAMGIAVLLHAVLLILCVRLPSVPGAGTGETVVPVQLVSLRQVEQKKPIPTSAAGLVRPQLLGLRPLHGELVARLASLPTLIASPVARMDPRRQSITVHHEPLSQPSRTAAPPGIRHTLSDYAALLAVRLAQVKRYPPQAWSRREQGVVLLRFRLDRRGHVLSWRIVRSSGHAALDREVGVMIESAAPFPPFPRSMTQQAESFLVPIEFSLR